MVTQKLSSSFIVGDQSNGQSVSSFCARNVGHLLHFQACGRGATEAPSRRLASTTTFLGKTFPGTDG
jgi:hypothetical protein